jgi:hypothetical protein
MPATISPKKATPGPTAEAYCAAARAVAAYALGVRSMRVCLSGDQADDIDLPHTDEYRRAVIELAGCEGPKGFGHTIGSNNAIARELNAVLSFSSPALLKDAGEGAGEIVKRHAKAIQLVAEKLTAGRTVNAATIGLAIVG